MWAEIQNAFESIDLNKFDHPETGAKAPFPTAGDVAAEAATHKALPSQVQRPSIYQLSWKTLPGLRGLACSGFRAMETAAPDHERGIAAEFGSTDEREAFLAELEAHFAAQRFSN